MASIGGVIHEAIWRNKDFRALRRTAQCAYFQLLSQKDLDCAGILILNIDVLVKGCDEMTVNYFWDDLKILEESRFIVIDTDTDQVLVRSYIRLVSARSPNMWKAAKRLAGEVDSPRIRTVLAGELRRLGRSDADELAGELTAGLEPLPNSSETLPEPFGNTTERGNPSETLPEPPASASASASNSPPVDGWVGRPPPKNPGLKTGEPAPCPKHPGGYEHGEPCHACKALRRWDEGASERRKQERADAIRERDQLRQELIGACPHCDETGMRENESGIPTRCDEHERIPYGEPF